MTALAIILSAFLAIAAAAMIIDNKERKAREARRLSGDPRYQEPKDASVAIPKYRRGMLVFGPLCAIVILLSTLPWVLKEKEAPTDMITTPALLAPGVADTLEVAMFKSYGLVYHVRYNAATKTILLSEDYDQLIRLMDAGQLVVVFTGRDGHLAAARRLEDGGAYEIAGERYSPPGNDTKTLYRRWKRAGIRYIEPSVH